MDNIENTYFLIGAGRLFNTPVRSRVAIETRQLILEELNEHHGNLLVVDDDFSEGIHEYFDDGVNEELLRVHGEGHVARRIWGCPDRQSPFSGWTSYGPKDEKLVFKEDEEAVRQFGNLAAKGEVTLAGGWLGLAQREENINRAHEILKSEFSCDQFRIGDSAFVNLRREYTLISGAASY